MTNEELQTRIDKQSFLLGIAWGYISAAENYFEAEKIELNETAQKAAEIFYEGLEELYHKNKV